MPEQPEDHERKFEDFFQQKVIRNMPRMIEELLNQVRQADPEKWLELATALRKLGPYDRIEKTKDRAEEVAAALDELTRLIRLQLPNLTKVCLEAAEDHFVRHGIELDVMIQKHPVQDPLQGQSVEDLLRDLHINWKRPE